MAETNPIVQTSVLQIPTTVRSLVEALIFGAREPLSARDIQAMYEDEGSLGSEPRKISYEEIARIVEELNAEYTSADRPYRILQIAGGYQFATVPAYAEWLGKLYKEQARRKLSQSSIETLAIIAYKQPITKPELESIRGVNCDYVIKTLLEKDLATIVGRASTVGRPLLYGTSKEFLKHFGLNDLNDLPRPREIQEILGDGQFETERRMLEAQQGLGEKKEEEFKSRLPHIPKRKAGLDDDVKILPKKRTREIKVRPAEETAASLPGEVMPSEEIVTPAPAQEQIPFTDEIVSSTPQDVPIIENDEIPQEPSAESKETEESDQPAPPEQTDYLALTRPADLESVENLPAEESLEAPPVEVGPPESEPTIVDTVEEVPAQQEQPVPTLEAVAADVPQIEVSLETNESETQTPAIDQVPIEEPIVEEQADLLESRGEPPIVQQASATDVVEDRPPEPASSASVEQPVSSLHSEPEPSPEATHGHQASSQPKTRWKSWKEKIQGFIKKLFG